MELLLKKSFLALSSDCATKNRSKLMENVELQVAKTVIVQEIMRN